MQGNIDFSGTLSGMIDAGGGGGGIIDVQVNNTQVPDYESVVENDVAKIDLYPYTEKSETYILIGLVSDEIIRVDGKVGDLEQIVPTKQDKLTAGNNIRIVDNVISADSGGGGVNYSFTEQDTGITWFDGRHIYQKSFQLTEAWQLTTSLKEFPFDVTALNIDVPVGCEIFFNGNRGPVPCKEIRKLTNRTYLQISGVAQFNLDANTIFTVRYIKATT